ncbi:MAG: VCBS repeat-containing protein, partial [Alcanivoracaceae bacterium]|nr:VCBS repeat-containing protein [Alcanivoracaceae bacterium]
MKRLALLILLTTTLHSQASIPDNMPEIVYDDIVDQVFLDAGFYDSAKIEEAISQWLLAQPLPNSDGQLIESGGCETCVGDDLTTDASFHQPRNLKIKAKANPQGEFPTTYKVTWKEPAPLPANSPYKISHYNVYLSKNSQSYEIFKVEPKLKRNGKLNKNLQLKIKDAEQGQYSVQVQAVYISAPTSTIKSQQKSVEYITSGWTDQTLYVATHGMLRVIDLTGALKTCINSAGYQDIFPLHVFTLLDCRNSNLQDSDILQLADFTNLQSLVINNNPAVTDLSALYDLAYLSLLSLEDNLNINLSLGNLTELKDLYLNNMGLTSLPDLSTNNTLEFLDLSDNQIATGFVNLPVSLTVLKLNNNIISSCAGLSGFDIETVELEGDQVTSISECSGINGLKYLNVTNAVNLTGDHYINDFAGFCGLNIENTNIGKLKGGRPVNFLSVRNNAQLDIVNLIKPARNFINSSNGGLYINPPLIPLMVRLDGSNNMSCKDLYESKILWDDNNVLDMTVPVTVTENSIEKTMSACPARNNPKTFILPNTCHPELVLDFTAIKDPLSYNYSLNWSQTDHDIWGVTTYEIRINGTEVRTIPFEFELPLSLDLASQATGSFEVRACTETSDPENPLVSCGDWQSTITTLGLDKVTNLQYNWLDQNAGTLNLSFDYLGEITGIDSSTPDFFMVLPGALQTTTSSIPPVTYVIGNSAYNTASIDIDDYFGYNYKIKACKNTDIGEILCGQSTSVIIDVSTPADLSAPVTSQATTITTTTGDISLSFTKNPNDLNVDYFKVEETQPVPVIDGPPIIDNTNIEVYTIDVDSNDSATLKLIRKVNGNYKYLIYACINDTESLEHCSASALQFNTTVTRTIKNQNHLSHITGAPSEDPNFTSVYLHRVQCNVDTSDPYYDGSKCTGNDFDYWFDLGGVAFYPNRASAGYFHKQAVRWDYHDNNNSSTPDYFYLSKENISNSGKNKDLGIYGNTSLSNHLSLNSCVNKLQPLKHIDASQVAAENFYAKQSIIHRSESRDSQRRWSTTEDCSSGVRVNSDGLWRIKACYDGIGCTNGKIVDLNTDTGYKSLSIKTSLKDEEPISKAFTKAAIQGPIDIQPGLWWNPYQAGTGWYFYWKNNSENPDKELNDNYDLLAYWVTYRNINGLWSPVWMSSTLKLQQFDGAGNQFFTGQLLYTNLENNSRNENNVGTIKVLLNQDFLDENNAIVELDIDDGFGLMTSYQNIDHDDTDVANKFKITYNIENVSGIDRVDSLSIPLELASIRLVSDTDVARFGLDHDGEHFQGVWQYRETADATHDADILVWKTKNLEVVDYFIFDGNESNSNAIQEPLWVQSQTCADTCNEPVDDYFDGYLNENDGFGASSNNFFTIVNAFNPLGYSHSSDVRSDNEFGFVAKGGRSFAITGNRYQEAQFWMDINMDINSIIEDTSLGFNSRWANKSIGSAINMKTMVKVANLHHIGFNIQDIYGNIQYNTLDDTQLETTCDPDVVGPCIVKFNWYTDSGDTDIQAFYKTDGMTDFAELPMSVGDCVSLPDNQYLVSSYKCANLPVGTYEFELRKPAIRQVGQWITIAQSALLIIESCNSGDCSKPPTVVIPTVDDAPVGVAADGQNYSIEAEITHQQGAGPIPGSGGVSGGAATYNLPLAIPPGRNGMTPSVSVNYSSKGGNGTLGIGWSISAGSSIYRCPQTLAQDDNNHAVDFTTDDRLCLDGQRLMLRSDSSMSYFVDGSTYSTEQDSFAEITKISALEFEVKTKSGRTNTYIQQQNLFDPPPDSNGVIPEPQRTTWQLVKETDSFNNNIKYSYTDRLDNNNRYGRNEWLLDKIIYTGHGFSDGTRIITFNYQDRMKGYATKYLANEKTESTQRLNNVVITTPNGTHRTYGFNYVDDNSEGLLLLDFVTEQAGTVIAPRTVLQTSWQGDQVYSLTKPAGGDLSIPPIIVDPQMVALINSQLEVSSTKSIQTIFGEDDNELNIQSMRLGADINGDGSKEVLAGVKDTNGDFSYQLLSYSATGELKGQITLVNNGNSVSPSVITNGSGNADFNGDGITDMLFNPILLPNSNNFQIAIWQGGDISTGTTSVAMDQVFRLFNTGVPSLVGTEPNRNMTTADINNDGYPDLIYTRLSEGNDCFNDAGPTGNICDNTVYFREHLGINSACAIAGENPPCTHNPQFDSTERSIVTIDYSGFSSSARDQIAIQDLNADGHPDILVNNGTEGLRKVVFTGVDEETITFNSYTVEQLGIEDIDGNETLRETYYLFTDLNADGLEDFLFVADPPTSGAAEWKYQLNTGKLTASGNLFSTVQPTGLKGHVNGLPEDGDCGDVEYGGVQGLNPNVKQKCSPRRAAGLVLADVNSDGINDILLPDPDDVLIDVCVTAYTKLGDNGEEILADRTIPPEDGGFDFTREICSGSINDYPLPVEDEFNYYKYSTFAGLDRSVYGHQAFIIQPKQGGSMVEIGMYLADSNIIPTIYKRIGSKDSSGDLFGDGDQDYVSRVVCPFTDDYDNGFTPGSLVCSEDLVKFDTLNSSLQQYIATNYPNAIDADAAMDEIADNIVIEQNETGSGEFFITRNDSTTAGLVSSVGKPDHNLSVKWQYQPLSTDNSNISDERYDFPLYTVPDRLSDDSYVDEDQLVGEHFYFNSSMYVVSEMRQTNNYGTDAINEYAYEEAVYNNQGRGFQGFRKITVKSNPADGSIYETASVSTFHQVFPLAGKLESVMVTQKDPNDLSAPFDDVLISEENFCYKGEALTNGVCDHNSVIYDGTESIVYYPLSYKHSKNYELNNSTLSSESITDLSAVDAYDIYGNIKNQSQTITSYLPGGQSRTETVSTVNSYDQTGVSNWWIDKLQTTHVTKSVDDTRDYGDTGSIIVDDGSHTTYSKFIWKASNQRKLDCQYTSLLNLTAITGCTDVNINTKDISMNKFTYDADLADQNTNNDYGNIIDVTTVATDHSGDDSSRTVTTSYTADGYFPSIITRVTDANALTGLETTFDDYDIATGQVKKVTSPDGNSVTSNYDAFGFKLTSTIKDTGS